LASKTLDADQLFFEAYTHLIASIPRQSGSASTRMSNHSWFYCGRRWRTWRWWWLWNMCNSFAPSSSHHRPAYQHLVFKGRTTPFLWHNQQYESSEGTRLDSNKMHNLHTSYVSARDCKFRHTKK